MARKGDIAKATVLEKIGSLYPDAIYSDKKLYIWETDEGGEKVQIAISMTMPKTAVTSGESIPKATSGAAPWENAATVAASTKKLDQMVVSADEEAMVAKLMEKLGISE